MTAPGDAEEHGEPEPPRAEAPAPPAGDAQIRPAAEDCLERCNLVISIFMLIVEAIGTGFGRRFLAMARAVQGTRFA